jgi:hypothetical protein
VINSYHYGKGHYLADAIYLVCCKLDLLLSDTQSYLVERSDVEGHCCLSDIAQPDH